MYCVGRFRSEPGICSRAARRHPTWALGDFKVARRRGQDVGGSARWSKNILTTGSRMPLSSPRVTESLVFEMRETESVVGSSNQALERTCLSRRSDSGATDFTKLVSVLTPGLPPVAQLGRSAATICQTDAR